jgi:precorrin-3B synthase
MSAVAVAAKGWCPGALRPMPSGDGLIVRVRPSCGAVNLDQARGLADLVRRLGNGHIDLTRRANLQLRGLSDERLPELHDALRRLALIDADAETEATRNIMVAPLAGPDVRSIATALEHALTGDPRLRALPAKFGILVDDGGPLSIAGERADICLAATGQTIAFGLDAPTGTAWLGTVVRDRAVEVAMAAARVFLSVARSGRMRDHVSGVRTLVMPLLSALEARPQSGRRRLGLLDGAVGIAAPFGRLDASQLRRLAELAADTGATDIRLSPWRAVYVSARHRAAALLDGAREAGLIVDDNDPVLRIEACPGAPDCHSSSVDARGDARLLAKLAGERGYQGSIHVSGCAKRCARSAPSDLLLIGEDGLYRLGERLVGRKDFPGLVEAVSDG